MRSRSLTVAVLCRRLTHHEPSTEPRPQGSGRLPVTGLATDSGPLGGSLPISNLERDGHARMLPGRKPAWRTPAQPSSSAMASFSIIWRKRITSTPPCELVRLVSSAARFCSRAASGAPRRLSSRRLMAGSVCASLNRKPFSDWLMTTGRPRQDRFASTRHLGTNLAHGTFLLWPNTGAGTMRGSFDTEAFLTILDP